VAIKKWESSIVVKKGGVEDEIVFHSPLFNLPAMIRVVPRFANAGCRIKLNDFVTLYFKINTALFVKVCIFVSTDCVAMFASLFVRDIFKVIGPSRIIV